MVVNFIERLGCLGIRYYQNAVDFFIFLFTTLFYIFNPLSYFKINISNLINSIYENSVKTLFSFISLALFLGSVIIGIAISLAINYNLQDHIGTIVAVFIINEFAPLFTVFFMIYKYRFKIYKDIANYDDKKNIYEELYIPNLLSGIVAVPTMAILFATSMLISGYLISFVYLNMDFVTYKRIIINAVELNYIVTIILKGIILGYIAKLVPIYYGNKYKNKISQIDTAESTIKILGILIGSIFVTEILLLLIVY